MLRFRDIKLVQSQTAEAMAQLKALLRSQRSFGMQVCQCSNRSRRTWRLPCHIITPHGLRNLRLS